MMFLEHQKMCLVYANIYRTRTYAYTSLKSLASKVKAIINIKLTLNLDSSIIKSSQTWN